MTRYRWTERDRAGSALAGAMDAEKRARWGHICDEERAINREYAARVAAVLVARGWRFVLLDRVSAFRSAAHAQLRERRQAGPSAPVIG